MTEMTQPGDPQKLQAAFSLHQAGKLDQAADLYRQIISRDQRNFPALHYLGLIEAAHGNYQQAKALLERSLSTEPPNLQFMENYASILFQTGSYEAALQAKVDAAEAAFPPLRRTPAENLCVIRAGNRATC